MLKLTQKHLLITAVICSCISLLIILQSQSPNTILSEISTSNTKEVEAVIAPESMNSNLETYNNKLGNIDSFLSNSDLDDEQKIKLLLRKGYILPGVRSSSEIGNSIDASLESFTIASTTLARNPSLYSTYIDAIKFGPLYIFAMNCFARGIVFVLPEEHRAYTRSLFPSRPAYDNNSATNTAVHQEVAFTAMLDYIYKDVDLARTTDKSIISNRMFVTATYLSSFASKLTATQREDLRKLIHSDLEKYNSATFSVFSYEGKPYHIMGELQSLFQYTFAYDVYTSFGDSNTDTDQTATIDVNYDILERAIANSPSTDSVSLSMLGMMMEGYHLSSLYRRYGSTTVDKPVYENALAYFKKYIFSHPEVADIAKGSFNFSLSPGGQWNTEKRLIFELTKVSPELKNIFTSIGVTL